MIEYFLPNHVHYCFRGDALIFLDLQRDDYLLMEEDTAAALRSLSNPGPQMEPCLERLARDGLLTTNPMIGRHVAATRTELATERLVELEMAPRVRAGAHHILNFAAACIAAGTRLRFSSIERTVHTVAQRKMRAKASSIDLDKARDLTALFHTLRLFYPRDYLCLYDSLALLEFLARYQLFPNWVFGVKLDPWAAHCWVQHRGFTFNEGVEEAANYTPIMVI